MSGSGPAALRSQSWLGERGKNGFITRSHLRALGLDRQSFDGRPVIGICNSWSELVPCNAHLKLTADAVRRGVLEAGGVPLEFSTMSLGEPLMRPSTMLFRNLMAIEVEETIRANPLDAVVLLGSCDKTVPAQLLGAASADVPAIAISGGPMLSGRFRGQQIGSGTDVWRFTEEVRAGRMTEEAYEEAEGSISRSSGHCMTMGTASTMACIAEALGMQLPGLAATPAVDARRAQLATASGRRVVQLARQGPRPAEILTRTAFENAIRVNAAIGGSTNAVLHLLALAGRVGVELDLDDFDTLARDVPLLVDLRPSGRFLMEDFAYAGGVPALLNELSPLLDLNVLTVNGGTLAESIVGANCWDREVIKSLRDPVQAPGQGTVVVRGNLAPDGAVLKVSAASPELLVHRGKARVFDSLAEYLEAAANRDLDIEAGNVIVLRNVGPRGYPGMPEVGNLPLPIKLLQQGVTDMVRISDARMSGTSYGTVVLHVAPEAATGSPLALVHDFDEIELDVVSRRLELHVSPEELERRAAAWHPPEAPSSRGWLRLFHDHVLQADRGVDFDFLVGATVADVPRVPF